MLFTCSFPKNATVEAACCDKGPKPGNLSLFTIDSNNASYCAVNDDLDDLTDCLADHQVVFDECHIEGVSASTTTNQGTSSATPSRPSRLGLLLTAFLGLSLLAGVSAADSEVVCKKFTPKDKADWDVNARTEGQSITQGYVDCRGGHSPCIVGSQNEGNPPPIFSAVWDSPRGVKVDADLRPLIKSAQEADSSKQYSETVTWPEIPNHTRWKIHGGAVVGLKVSASATRIPGTFSDCKDTKTYEGSAVIPRADEFWVKAEQDYS